MTNASRAARYRDGDDDEPADEGVEAGSLYYGHWQTIPYVPPSATTGRVPRNERGQVDMWTPAHLPGGCTHVKIPGILKTANVLGIDAVKAMTGFEVKQGRSVPVFDGVIVCTPSVDILIAAHNERTADADRRAAEKRQELIDRHWRRIVSGTLARHEAQQKIDAQVAENQPLPALPSRPAEAATGAAAVAAIAAAAAAAMDMPPLETSSNNNNNGASVATSASSATALNVSSIAARLAADIDHEHVYINNAFDNDTRSWIRKCACGQLDTSEEI